MTIYIREILCNNSKYKLNPIKFGDTFVFVMKDGFYFLGLGMFFFFTVIFIRGILNGCNIILSHGNSRIDQDGQMKRSNIGKYNKTDK